MRKRRERTVLYLNYASVAQLDAANQLEVYTQGICSDRAGTFDRVVALLFPVGRRGRLQLSPHVTLYEFDLPEIGWLARTGLAPLGRVIRWLAAIAFALALVWRYKVSYLEATEPYLRGLSALVISRLIRKPFGMQCQADFDLIYETTGEVHGGANFKWRRLTKAIEHMVFRNADVLVADRERYGRYMIENGGSASRLIVGRVLVDSIYYGDPSTRGDGKAALGVSGKRILLYTGRLAAEKHVLDLVQVLSDLRRRGLDVMLVMAGIGPLESELGHIARSLGVANELKLTGAVPVVALAQLVASADVSLAPYSGLSLVEAALSASPIVAYDWEWHREVVHDGVTGLLVPPEDWKAMADAVERLLEDEPLRQQLGHAARAFALQHHGPNAVLQSYRQQFERVLPRKA